jgi:hypothetical protein
MVLFWTGLAVPMPAQPKKPAVPEWLRAEMLKRGLSADGAGGKREAAVLIVLIVLLGVSSSAGPAQQQTTAAFQYSVGHNRLGHSREQNGLGACHVDLSIHWTLVCMLLRGQWVLMFGVATLFVCDIHWTWYVTEHGRLEVKSFRRQIQEPRH